MKGCDLQIPRLVTGVAAEQFQALTLSEYERWGKVIREAASPGCAPVGRKAGRALKTPARS